MYQGFFSHEYNAACVPFPAEEAARFFVCSRCFVIAVPSLSESRLLWKQGL